MEKASGVNLEENPELEPLRQSVVVYNLILATPATALVPNSNSFAVPLDQPVTRRGGTCYMGNNLWSNKGNQILHRRHSVSSTVCPVRMQTTKLHGAIITWCY